MLTLAFTFEQVIPGWPNHSSCGRSSVHNIVVVLVQEIVLKNMNMALFSRRYPVEYFSNCYNHRI
jgi:hypothetical protein